MPLLVEQLRSADKAVQHRPAHGPRTSRRGVTEALVAELGRATPERQAAADPGVGRPRRRQGAAAVLPRRRAAPSRHASRPSACWSVWATLRACPSCWMPRSRTKQSCRRRPSRCWPILPGKEVDADLAARLPQAEGKMRRVLIELAGQRCARGRSAAIAEGRWRCRRRDSRRGPGGLRSTVIDCPTFRSDRSGLQPQWPEDAKTAEAALRAACVRMPDREACAAELVRRMSQAPVPAACTLLAVLGEMGGTKALQAVGAAAKDANPEIQDTASRLLGEWMTADAAPVLLDLAKTVADERYKTRALRGYIRIARQLELPPAERVAMCGEAMKLCQRDNEKNLVIEVLRRNPSAAGLALVTPHLHNPELKTEASEAALAIAEKIVQSDPAAVAEAMKQVAEASRDSKVTDRAKALLDRAARKSAHSAPRPALPIKVSENGRYFVDQNGTPLFWLGTTQWQLFREYTLDDAKTHPRKIQAERLHRGPGHAHGRRRRHDAQRLTARSPGSTTTR